LSAEVSEVNAALREIENNEEQIEGLLDFAESVLRDPAAMWAKASLDQRQRLQTVLFPDGLTYSHTEGFGTAQAPSFFNVLQAMGEENSSLASPTGFEPVLPP
jgi:hypothetical protein